MKISFKAIINEINNASTLDNFNYTNFTIYTASSKHTKQTTKIVCTKFHKFTNAIQSTCKSLQHQIIQYYHSGVYTVPNKSFTPANVITNDATNKSAIARDAKNKFPILRKLRSV